MSTHTDIQHHNLYVIELDKKVLQDENLVKQNPQYKEGMPCLYVGMTKYTPEKRFNYHLVGYKSHEYIRRYAKRLAQEYVSNAKPLTYEEALAEEHNLADRLKDMGCAVWEH